MPSQKLSILACSLWLILVAASLMATGSSSLASLQPVHAVAATALTGTLCTWDGSTGDWLDSSKWSCSIVPGASDTAIVNAGNPILSTNATVGSLQLGGGSITSNATLTISAAFTWTAGEIKGSGPGGVISNGNLSLSGPAYKSLNGRSLTNNGSAVWTGGYINAINSASLLNEAGASFEIATDALFIDTSASFINSGTLTKSTGSTNPQEFYCTFTNNGTLNVNAGILRFYASSNSGTINIANGAQLEHSLNTHSYQSGSSINGAGKLDLLSGTINFNGSFNLTGPLRFPQGSQAFASFNNTITITTLEMQGGTLSGTGNLTVSGAMTWAGGTITGSGSFTIPTAVPLIMSGDYKQLNGRTITNNGNAIWTGGTIQLVAASFRNQADGTFEIHTDAVWAGGNDTTLVNAGNMTKIVGSINEHLIGSPFTNTGTLNIDAGVLQFNNSINNSGSINVGAGARIGVTLGAHTFSAGSSLNGAGDLLVAGGLDFNGTFNLTGVVRLLTATGTEANFNTPVTIDTLDMQGGGLGGSGDVTIASSMTCALTHDLKGVGTLIIAPSATLNLNLAGSLNLYKRISNRGVINWNSGRIDMFTGGVISNEAGATLNFVANTDAGNINGLMTGNAPGNALNNSGRAVRQNAPGVSPTSIRLPFNNAGVLEITNADFDLRTTLQGFEFGTVTQSAGTTLLNDGTLIGGLAINGGKLMGVGRITQSVTNNGLIAPGLVDSAPGTITINGNYTQTENGRLDIEIGGTNPGINSDLLSTSTTVSTSATLAGTLDVSMLAGFIPAADVTLQIMRYNSRAGVFTTISGLELGGGKVLAADYRALELVLVSGNGGPAVPWIEAVPNPPQVRGTPGAPFDFGYTLKIGNSGGEPMPVVVVIELPAGPVINPVTGERKPVDDEIEDEISNEPVVPIQTVPREDNDEIGDLVRSVPKKFARDDGTAVIPFVMNLPPGSNFTLQGKFQAYCPSPAGNDPMPKVKIVGTSAFPSSQCVADVLNFALGFVPGADCLNIARNFFVSQSVSLVITGKPVSLGSVLATLAFDAAKCAADVVPVLKAVKIVKKVIDLASGAVDLNGIRDSCRNSLLPDSSAPELQADTGTECVSAKDPNLKLGPEGTGSARYLTGAEPLRYTVFFENIPDATAPAQTVMIRDQLDPTLLNLGTFALGPIAFAGKEATPTPNASSFTTDVDMRPEKNLLVRINANLDQNTGLLTWIFTSIDPMTLQPIPTTSTEGFLNPNRTRPEGEGSVAFIVQPKSALPTGTLIRNRTTIIFDANDPIPTPEWSNTLENDKPTSNVQSLSATQCSSFRVQWSGSDGHSGVASYSIFVSKNGGAFEAWLRHTDKTSEFYNGESGNSYAFYSVARDKAGNVEAAPTQPDTVTSVITAMTILPTTQSFSAEGGSGTVNVAAASSCAWIALSRDFFLYVNTGATGTGNGTVTYTVDPNPSDETRTGFLVIAGHRFIVEQAAGPATGNRAPIAEDDTASTNQGVPVNIAVLTNDSDPDNDPLTVSSVTAGTNGTVTINPDNTVRYSPNGAYSGTDSFAYTVSDSRGGTTSAAVRVSIIANADTSPPAVESAVKVSSMWPPNHDLVNVGLSASAIDAEDGPLQRVEIKVYADEDDEEPTGDDLHSPDAKNIGTGTLRLRAERKDTGDGRVYLIVIRAVDSSGNVGISCKTIVVPYSRSAAAIAAVDLQASNARAHCQANSGAPPAGFVLVGDGIVIGPKQ